MLVKYFVVVVFRPKWTSIKVQSRDDAENFFFGDADELVD